MLKPVEAAEDLIGRVKKVEAQTVSLFEENGEILEHPESESVAHFDESNNPVEISHLYPNIGRQKTVNRFDSKNNPVEQFFYREETLKHKREFIYNDREQMVEMKFFDYERDLQGTFRPVYTKEGLRIDEFIHEPFLFNGKNVIGQISFEVAPEIRVSFSDKDVYREKKISGADGRLLEVVFYNRLRLPTGRISVLYDSGEKPVKIIKYGDDTSFLPQNASRLEKLLFPVLNRLENFLQTLLTAYRLLKRRDFEKARNCLFYGAPVDEIFAQYDERQIISEINFRSTCFLGGGKTTFEYDEKVNKTGVNHYSAGEILSDSEKYEYDPQNNWVKRKAFFSHSVGDGSRFMERTVLTRRTIEYY